MNYSGNISFTELFDKEETEIQRVVIPKIQRAYAQGRTDAHASRVRERFLTAIHDALINGQVLTLDFIYGNEEKGVLVPLDGQQRLTTLFLLHWYAAKREERKEEEYGFLKYFTYETRYSARDFCLKLVDFSPSFSCKISEDIIDQTWFPIDWLHDSTVASMLVMLDAIQDKFSDVDHLWEKLGLIKFYFQKLEDMKLTDDIYIKMNSRGKPLSDFENFKAELEKGLEKVLPPSKVTEISKKIDIDWTNLLWQYAICDDSENDRPSTDEAFLHYFRYICDILCYRSKGSPNPKDDEFKLLERYFSGDDVEKNVDTLCAFFDCWASTSLTDNGKNIDGFFDSFLCKEHTKNKIKLPSGYNTNLFKDCIRDYSKTIRRGSQGRRVFPLNKIILLYATIVYLQNSSTVGDADFRRRFRIVNNLVMNSQYEISDSEHRDSGNRIPAILSQVDSIILKGEICENITLGGPKTYSNFNEVQLREERAKQRFLSEHPEHTKSLFELEDHNLLMGHIGIVGLENPCNFKKFSQLFDCDWDLVDCALFSMGDYSQRDKMWRIQVGTKNKTLERAWINLFHFSKTTKGYEKTQECLRLLFDELGEDITDNHLRSIIENFLSEKEKESRFEWWYYYVKYNTFRMGRYGKYEQVDENKYNIIGMYGEGRVSSKSYNLFLYTINNKCSYVGNERTKLEEFYVYSEKDSIEVRIVEDETETLIDKINIKQENNIDIENRIEVAREWLKDTDHLRARRLSTQKKEGDIETD